MQTELLPAYVENALAEAESALPRVLSSPASLRDVLAVCEDLRIAGIGEFLMTGRFAPFGWRLHQSARIFATALPRLPDTARLTSRAAPFFDALASGDTEAAAEIGGLCRRTWTSGEEYEEDFLFSEILIQHAAFGSPREDSLERLARYEAALVGTEDLRLPILRALVESDEAGFDKALKAWLKFHARSLDRRAGRRSYPPEQLATIWHVNVQGVALVRLARASGMKTAKEYATVPSAALEEAPIRWDSAWTRITSDVP